VRFAAFDPAVRVALATGREALWRSCLALERLKT
jgi:hypothetical protein